MLSLPVWAAVSIIITTILAKKMLRCHAAMLTERAQIKWAWIYASSLASFLGTEGTVQHWNLKFLVEPCRIEHELGYTMDFNWRHVYMDSCKISTEESPFGSARKFGCLWHMTPPDLSGLLGFKPFHPLLKIQLSARFSTYFQSLWMTVVQ